MAIDDAGGSDDGGFADEGSSDPSSAATGHEHQTSPTTVGTYTWADFMAEYGYEDEISTLYPHGPDAPADQLGLDTESTVPTGTDWDRVEFDPTAYLGRHPDDLETLLRETAIPNMAVLREAFLDYVDPTTTPVVKDVWTWEHYKWEYYYEADGSRPRASDGSIDRFDGEEALGFDPDEVEATLASAGGAADALASVVDERTVRVQEEFDEDSFFSTDHGTTTVTNRYDLEKTVPMAKKPSYREVERYWVNKPYVFVIIFHSEKENEKKYYVVEPHANEIEAELTDFLSGKLRTAIKYAAEHVHTPKDDGGRAEVIERETRRLMRRYDLFERTAGSANAGLLESIKSLLGDEDEAEEDPGPRELEGIEVRPEPVVLAEDPDTLNEYQVEKLLYRLKRDFIGYERIDGIKHDINVEDISCDGYNSPVFVYHSEYEQIISNVFHGEDELDDFVVKLAQRSGKGISKRLPQVDATLPDGSRAQLTLGKEVSDHGTNYTIRQFKDVPFTPIDLINWKTFSLDEMAYLWLCIENHKSLLFAGGTASGKTTSLNAVSLFIPSNAKIVSIEDTREVELPQRNWIASVTRPSFSDDERGDVDEFDLLEAALRQRPEYIVMGEIRGEEGRTLFQVMSTGHTTYTTFHADSVDEVLKRFTTDPINVSKTMFTALDLVSIQTQTRVHGRKVRRNKSLTEINHYEAEHDEINVQDVYQWQAETDEFLKMGDSNTLAEIQFDRGWSRERLEDELFKRQVILAYLITNGLKTYAEVAATVQAFINDPETILALMANDQLIESLEDLREMESVLIDVDPEKEALVPRPDPTDETYESAVDILELAEETLFEEYRGSVPGGLSSALGSIEPEDPVEAEPTDESPFDQDFDSDAWNFGESVSFDFDGDDDTGGVTEPTDTATADGPDAGEQGSPDTATASSTRDAQSVSTETDTGDHPVSESASDQPARPALEGASEFNSQPDADESGTTGDTTDQLTPVRTDADTESSDDDRTLDDLFSDMGDTLAELERSAAEPTEESPENETDAVDDGPELASLFEPASITSQSASDDPDDHGEVGGVDDAEATSTTTVSETDTNDTEIAEEGNEPPVGRSEDDASASTSDAPRAEETGEPAEDSRTIEQDRSEEVTGDSTPAEADAEWSDATDAGDTTDSITLDIPSPEEIDTEATETPDGDEGSDTHTVDQNGSIDAPTRDIEERETEEAGGDDQDDDSVAEASVPTSVKPDDKSDEFDGDNNDPSVDPADTGADEEGDQFSSDDEEADSDPSEPTRTDPNTAGDPADEDGT